MLGQKQVVEGRSCGVCGAEVVCIWLDRWHTRTMCVEDSRHRYWEGCDGNKEKGSHGCSEETP
jgi:hypothetical protein